MSQLEGMFSKEALPPSRNRRSPIRRIALTLVVVVLIAMGFGLFQLSQRDADTGFAGPGTGSATVVIESGDSLRIMGEKLTEAGVVASSSDFIDAASANQDAERIGPGTYTLRLQMGAPEAVELLLDPSSRATTRVALPEGLRLKQSLRTAAKSTGIPLDDFKAAAEQPDDLGLPEWANGELEGFMFPATYDVAEGVTAADVLRQFTDRFDQASTELDLQRRAEAIGKTAYEVLIIASLVEAEAKPTDFRKVAAVIENRLEADMPLQLDASVAYGLGVTDLQLSTSQLEEDTPYNTYQRKGLPPTPINSPGEAAIEAALAPAKGNWLYYVTVNPDTGETKFTKSYDRFLEFKAELRRFLAEAN